MVGGRVVHEEFDQVRDYVADGGSENVIGTCASEIIDSVRKQECRALPTLQRGQLLDELDRRNTRLILIFREPRLHADDYGRPDRFTHPLCDKRKVSRITRTELAYAYRSLSQVLSAIPIHHPALPGHR